MPEISTGLKNSGTGKIIFIVSLAVSTFWYLEQLFNIYHVALVGTLYELLWLPFLCTLFVLPIVSMIFWVKEKFTIRSLHLYSLLIVVTTILLMVTGKKALAYNLKQEDLR